MKYHIEFEGDFKRNTYPGKFIAIEGIDGSGKTTQVEILAQHLQRRHTVFITKNPTDGEIGKFIRKVLSREIHLPPVSFQYLFSADRQVQQVEILEKLKKGEWVITDRYFWSALAYGVVDRGGNEDDELSQLLIAQGILSQYHQFVIPDFTFYLDISIDTALKRLQSAEKEKELYEEKEPLKKIKNAYELLLKKFPEEITVINGELVQEDVFATIVQKLNI